MSGISQTGFQSFSQTRIQSTSQSRSYSSNVSRGGLLHSDHSHASELPPKPKKRIIICCDGTWQSSAHGTHTIPSNVAKMSRSIASWYIDENELMAPQIVYYDAGVGTAMGRLGQKWAGKYGMHNKPVQLLTFPRHIWRRTQRECLRSLQLPCEQLLSWR
jgi:hypothetical protein